MNIIIWSYELVRSNSWPKSKCRSLWRQFDVFLSYIGIMWPIFHSPLILSYTHVPTISKGSAQTTEIYWCTVSECAGWSISSYKFYCRFCHAQTHARVVCANLNAKHPGYNFQQTTFWNIFLILPREQDLHFMQIVSTAWNVKSCFLGNEKKKKNSKSVVRWISPESPFWRRFPADALGLYNASLFSLHVK